jgi:hypothetical protein
MAAASRIHSVINAWETVRYELMNTRICDLPLHIERSPVEPYVQRLKSEFAAKRFAFVPEFYLPTAGAARTRFP